MASCAPPEGVVVAGAAADAVHSLDNFRSAGSAPYGRPAQARGGEAPNPKTGYRLSGGNVVLVAVLH
jgi:hypothetical protein